MCLPHGDSPDPFVIDWPSDRRADIEVALKRGTVVLSLSCTSARILPDCSAEGTYSFMGTTEREELLSLQTAEEVRANLPLLATALTAPSGGLDFAHGSTLDVALATIGRRSVSRSSVARAELKGECRDATHFVRSATLGAFAMGPGARGRSRGPADVFGRDAAGAPMARDGSLQACRTATPDAETAVAQCGAPIRLTLKALSEESVVSPGALAQKPADAPSCPTGMQRDEAGACATVSADRAHVCAWTDVADCAQQCEHGSPTSCSILGRSYQIGRGVPKDLARASDILTKACSDGATVACGRLGEMALAAHDEEKGLRLLNESCLAGWAEGCRIAGAYAVAHPSAKGVDVVALFRRGCRGGEPEACWSLGTLYSEGIGGAKNDGEAARWLALSCAGGASLGCAHYAKLVDAGRGEPADPARAVALLTSGCEGGYPSACADLATDYFTGHAVPRDAAKGMTLLERGCALGDAGTCFVAGMRLRAGTGVPADAAAATAMLTKACQAGISQACAALAKP
jgi:TPR repeat protein